MPDQPASEPDKVGEGPEVPAEQPETVVDAQDADAAATEPAPAADELEPVAQPTSAVIDDASTNQAVDDIVRHESDDLLTAEDKINAIKPAVPQKRGFWRSMGRGFAFWWRHSLLRWFTILVLLGGLGAAGAMPSVRYAVLNKAGVRVGASVVVLDNTSGQPLKGIHMTIGGLTAQTDQRGKASVSGLTLGPKQLSITEPGFASITKQVMLGWGSNPLGEFDLRSVGVQYIVTVHDYITGQALQGAEVSSGDALAVSDKNGKAVLTIPTVQTGDVSATVAKSGYRNEPLTIKALKAEPTDVQLVTSRRTVFVTKQATYDVYSSDIDGQNKKVLLAGTGTENSNISLVTSPDGSHAALVSTRDNQRDADGYLLNTLTIININDGSAVTVAHAQQIQLIDWIGTRLVFEQVTPEAKTQAVSNYSIISYDDTDNIRLQLATAPHFTTVFGAQNSIFYVITASDSDATVHPGLYKINADGTAKQSAVDTEVWGVYRTDYSTLTLQVADGWLSYNLASGAHAQGNAPAVYTTRGYINNAANTQSLWIDNRGSLGILTRYDIAGSKDSLVQLQDGVAYPVRWLGDDAAVYRVVNGSQVADYVVGVYGVQTAHKITDVINTYGFSAGQ